MTKIISWLAIAGLVVVGGYLVMEPKATEEKTQNELQEVLVEDTTKEEAPIPATGKKMAFSQFIKQGGAYKCTVNQTLSGIDTTGVTYINDSMIRGEFNTRIQNMNIDSTFIVRDGYTYSWSSVMPTAGFKVKMTGTVTTPDTTTGTTGSYSWNAEQIGDYDCQPWTVDQAKFTVPTNVTFKEINSN